MEVFHVASVGIDLMLGAMAYGASQVCILSTEKVSDGYREALKRQMGYAETIVMRSDTRAGISPRRNPSDCGT